MSNIISHLSVNKTFSYLDMKFIFSFYNFIGSSRRELSFLKILHKSLQKNTNFFVDGTVALDIYKQYESPFSCVNLCEKLSLNGMDTVHVLDSLSNHAKIYRHLMLDLKRAPGREAYPGDIFYLHAKILERYGQFGYMFNLGSITGFPIAEVHKDNITDYITTNLISITDGQ
ncbi:ATP synthase subunit alpha 1 [Nosema granulosis]|uniref:ATP synthase subunit alpha 1 n=1 Tax=Nosema granulosis TaxID=83296 RepID=A0A9P6GYN9_9MICR|nr:ATP synthase subunit alpha 1 [Nosema granulosis]